MGGTRSSSKRKSSSRKSSKISSEARRKNRGKKTKSRKLRHRDDSSFFASDDSRSLLSISSSSSEAEYSRGRSRSRSEVKGSSRKRARRSSSSRASGEDSRRAKKRKGSQKKWSKRNANSDTRKKSQKKKRRRERSVSSISSDSRSCSTCRGGGESEFQSSRGRSLGKSKDKRDLVKNKSEIKSNRNRSRSCSSCSRCSDSSGYNGKDIVPAENNLRRLRSVITVAKPPEGERKEWDKDGPKEEIECDHDDYPSCRSNDSNDAGSNREITHHSHVDLGRWGVENVKGDSHSRMNELTRSVVVGGVQDCLSNSHSDGDGANNSIKENTREVFPSLPKSDSSDLESILRLKALENLRKYCGGRQTNAKAPPVDEKHKSDCEAKQLATAKAELVQTSSPKEDCSGVVGATRILDQNPNPNLTSKSDPSNPATSYGKVHDGKDIVTERASIIQSVIHPPNQGAATFGNSKKEDLPPVELCKFAPRQESSGGILKQTRNANMLVAESNVNKTSSTETSEIMGQTSNNTGVGANNLRESSTSEPPSSSAKRTLEEYSSKDQQGEVKEGSQFEQKTMSVMRGGEMVQVSYKVYIPKKAPALARRQLRR